MSFIRILRNTFHMKKLDTFSALAKRTYSVSKNTVNLSDPGVQRYLRHIILEHEDLLMKNRRTSAEIQRLQQIKPIVNALEQRIALYDNIEALKEMKKKDEQDPEIKRMIAEEATIYLTRMKQVDKELISVLLEPVVSDGGIMLEVVAGAGGQEAMLFARELFNMYLSYAEYKGWDVDIASIDSTEIGGYRKASMLVEGYGAPELMKIEAGVHRVQRVPATEKGGRIHTSTVSVAVLPQPTDIELDIPEKDLTIETKRASGAGGQHVNTTDSAVRIVHNPTGTAVECQEGRSQIKNKQIAMQKLKTLLLQKQVEQQTSKIQSERKAQVGSANRNEKIRTYNYPQDRVTEHRDGSCSISSLRVFMEGGELLENLHSSLLEQQRYQALMDDIAEFTNRYKAQTSDSSS